MSEKKPKNNMTTKNVTSHKYTQKTTFGKFMVTLEKIALCSSTFYGVNSNVTHNTYV